MTVVNFRVLSLPPSPYCPMMTKKYPSHKMQKYIPLEVMLDSSLVQIELAPKQVQNMLLDAQYELLESIIIEVLCSNIILADKVQKFLNED